MNEKVHALINQQINKEFYSAYLYLDFSNYFEEAGLDGGKITEGVAGFHHGSQLAGENGNVFLGDFAFACIFNFADTQWFDAAALKFFARIFFIFSDYFAADDLVGKCIFAFEGKAFTLVFTASPEAA